MSTKLKMFKELGRGSDWYVVFSAGHQVALSTQDSSVAALDGNTCTWRESPAHCVMLALTVCKLYFL